MTSPVYLDYNATTSIDPAVPDAMLPYLQTHFGNPSSDHVYGYRAREAVAMAREQLAALLGAQPDEVILTGGSKANNLALFGIAAARRTRGNHIITSTIEHPAVREPLRALERQGYRITEVPIDQDGRVDPARVADAITFETILL
jgi:cysteine desulfurase